jgi:pimeloyl-ACP methyl ester carboxylesterase
MTRALPIALLALAACKSGDKSAIETPVASVAAITTTNAADLYIEAPIAKGSVETVEVADDRAALFVVGEAEESKRAIVHLHGSCAVARTDLEAWSGAARPYGTIVALEGDTPCPDGIGGRTWRADIATIDKRIDAALDAIRSVRGVQLDRNDVVLVGDDVGATEALSLAAQTPAKYTRLVLNGLSDVAPYDLGSIKAIAVLATDREPQDRARGAFETFQGEHVATKLWTLTGATHSDYGPHGARTIGQALAFVTQH